MLHPILGHIAGDEPGRVLIVDVFAPDAPHLHFTLPGDHQQLEGHLRRSAKLGDGVPEDRKFSLGQKTSTLFLNGRRPEMIARIVIDDLFSDCPIEHFTDDFQGAIGPDRRSNDDPGQHVPDFRSGHVLHAPPPQRRDDVEIQHPLIMHP